MKRRENMRKSYYYLIGANQKKACVLQLDLSESSHELTSQFEDISLIDLLSMNYTQEEFKRLVSNWNPLISVDDSTDFYILRVTKSKNNFFKFHTYELIYNYHLPANLAALKEKIYDGLGTLAKERYQKVADKTNRKLNLEATPFFNEYATRLIQNITGNSSSLAYFNHESYLTLDSHILNRLIDYTPNKKESLLNELLSYKKLRALVLEYLNYIMKKPWNKNLIQDRVLNHYPKFLYGLSPSDGYITIQEARRRFASFPPEPKLMTMKEAKNYTDLEFYHLEEQIKMQDFNNRVLEEIYSRGGLEAVFKEMDTNDIYNSTPEDLLRIGIYDMNHYMEIKNNTSRRKR